MTNPKIRFDKNIIFILINDILVDKTTSWCKEMQSVKSINQAKAVTEEKIITEESVVRDSILLKVKKTVITILFGDSNSINADSEKIRNFRNYDRAKNTEIASVVRLQTLFR